MTFWEGSPMSFGTFLVRQGMISPMQLIEAVELEEESRPPIGRLALELRKLTMKQLFAVLTEQAQSNKLFGKIAVDLGFLTQQDIAELLLIQADRATHFPQVLVRLGVFDEATLAEQLQEFYRFEADRQSVILDRTPMLV
jgi:hypothetical protein